MASTAVGTCNTRRPAPSAIGTGAAHLLKTHTSASVAFSGAVCYRLFQVVVGPDYHPVARGVAALLPVLCTCFVLWELRRTSSGKYFGQVDSDGQPHGLGTAVYADGCFYSGGWKEGCMDGLGVLKFANNVDMYQGSFRMSRRHGYGVHVGKATQFEGKFEDNLYTSGIWRATRGTTGTSRAGGVKAVVVDGAHFASKHKVFTRQELVLDDARIGEATAARALETAASAGVHEQTARRACDPASDTSVLVTGAGR